MSHDTMSIHFVNAALTGVRRLNIDVSMILNRAGIDAELLNQPTARVSLDQYTRLAQALWLVSKDEHLGFGRSPRRIGTFATMCRLMIHTPTLGEALQRGSEFYRLFGESWSMRITRDAHDARISLHVSAEHDPEHFVTESMLAIWHSLASWLVERRIPLERAHFVYPEPLHAREYKSLFFAPIIRFNQSCSEITFAADYLDIPIRQTEANLDDFLRTAPAQLLVKFKDSSSLTVRVREMLKTYVGAEMPCLNAVAARLYMSPQTLRRKLATEGKTYQIIKDNLRRDTAIHLLLRPELTVGDVSHQVGFSEPSTFQRAFKKWTGVTPGLYRNLHSDREG